MTRFEEKANARFENKPNTRFEQFKNMNIDELAEYLVQYIDEGPWDDWFDKKYCLDCPTITKKVPSILCENHMVDMEYSYCELNGRCKYLPESIDANNVNEEEKCVIKMWLEEKING